VLFFFAFLLEEGESKKKLGRERGEEKKIR
jgi:hypothetical protein